MININDYRLVTAEEKKKYPKPDCAVVGKSCVVECAPRTIVSACKNGEWSSLNCIYYVPLGFQFELEQPAEIEDLKKRVERLLELLKIAKCPNYDGSGFIVYETGGCGPDGEDDCRECVQEQCRWCDERGEAIKESEDL